MIVSHAHRFVFLKSRKTAGTSLEIALSGCCGPDDVITPVEPEDEAIRAEFGHRGPQHTAAPLRRVRPRDLWRREALRALARHRRPAYYNHLPAATARRWLGEDVWRGSFTFAFERNPFDKAVSQYWWFHQDEADPPDFTDHLRRFPAHRLSNWESYAIGDEVAVDFVGRFEHLEEDVRAIWQRLGLPGEPHLPRAKATTRSGRGTDDLYTPEARAIVERVCARELRHFGYTP